MKVLLTGATGHVGKVVARDLLEAGYEVLAVARSRGNLDKLILELESPLLLCAEMDLLDPSSISRAISEFGNIEGLVHLAANIDFEGDLESIVEGNLLATVNLIVGLKSTIRRVVYLSSIDVYGKPQFDAPMSEAHPTNPENYYGVGKLSGEKFLDIFSQEYKVSVTTLRCSSVYGPGEVIKRASSVFIQNAIQGVPLRIAGDGQDIRDYIYVDDVSRAVLKSLENSVSEIFNLGGSAVSILEIAETVKKVSGKTYLKIEFAERYKEKVNISLNNRKIEKQLNFLPSVTFSTGITAQYKAHSKKIKS